MKCGGSKRNMPDRLPCMRAWNGMCSAMQAGSNPLITPSVRRISCPWADDPEAYPTVDDSPETTRCFLAEDFDGDSDAAAECYFGQLKRVADEPRAQIVGHFDLLTKFDERERFFDETSPRYRAAALDAMDALVSAGKIFEVNTGAISRGWRTAPYPSRWALEQLKRRSARVTISSDSHSTDTGGLCVRAGPGTTQGMRF